MTSGTDTIKGRIVWEAEDRYEECVYERGGVETGTE